MNAQPPSDKENMKSIGYRGGVVRFRIPADWKEEYEEQGGGQGRHSEFPAPLVGAESHSADDEIGEVGHQDSGEERAARARLSSHTRVFC